jgi:hypothetical protein
LATLTVSGVQSASTTVNAGQLNDLVGQMTVQAGNNPVKVTSINLTNIGSVTPSYLQNIKLMDGSVQLGATITSLGSNNIATFDLSGAPLMLTSGQSAVLSLYADITGGVNRNFQFSIQQSSDIQAVDTTYGVGIGASFQTGGSFPIDFSQVTINNGGVVASRDANSPTTYAVAGNTNQVLGVFDVLASGDSIKFTEMDFSVSGNNPVNNFRVVDDQGAQIGTTVNVPAFAGTTYINEGSGSLNYIIPANTTRVLTVYGDLPSTASGTISVSFGTSGTHTTNGFTTNGTAAQSYTTYANAGVSPIPGNSLQVLPSGSNLLASPNYGLGSPVSAPAGAQNVEIGSYTFTAGQINPINLTGVTINVTSTLGTGSQPLGSWLTNLTLMNGTTVIGTPCSTVTAGNGYSFNGNSPIAIPANGTLTLGVYANVSSNAVSSTFAGLTSLGGVNASTQAGNAVTFNAVKGQDVTFTAGGKLTGSLSAGTAQSSYLGMNIPGVNVAQYQFVTDNNGAETLTQLNITDSASSTTSTAASDHSTFWNYRLTNSSGATLSTAAESASGTLSFSLTGLSIPANTTAYVNLVADTNSYPYASSSATHAFALNSYQYTNASLSTTTVLTSNNIGNLFTVYQTTMGVVGTSGWQTPNSASGVNNTVGEFTFTPGSGNISPKVISVSLSVNGSLIASGTTQVLGLYDATAPQTLLASTTLSSTTANTFTFSQSGFPANQWTFAPSTAKVLLVKQLGVGGAFASVTNGNGNYQVLLQGITWTDGVTPTISKLDPSISLPVASANITNLSN